MVKYQIKHHNLTTILNHHDDLCDKNYQFLSIFLDYFINVVVKIIENIKEQINNKVVIKKDYVSAEKIHD